MAEPSSPPEPQAQSPLKRRRVRISLATLVAVVSLATGILTLRDQIFPGDDEPTVVVAQEARQLSRFDGVAGHLAEARALVDFLDQHDDEAVYLEVGFPDLSPPGPVSGDNVVVEEVPFEGGTRSVITEIALMTECSSGIPVDEVNPTTRDGCTGTSLDIRGPETEDSGTFFQHGVPVIKGYFMVDVTGGLQMGLSPFFLMPLTFEQATQS